VKFVNSLCKYELSVYMTSPTSTFYQFIWDDLEVIQPHPPKSQL